METKEVRKERLVTLSCHSEAFASCHSERSEESGLFAIAEDGKINNLAEPKFDNLKE